MMINIAILLPSLSVGGAEMLIYEELSYLHNDGRFAFEVHIVFESGPLYNKYVSLGIPIRIWNAPHKSMRVLFTYYRIYRYLVDRNFDILHVHLLNTLGPLTGKLAKIKTLTTLHNDVEFNLVTRLCLLQSNLLLGCGRKVTDNLAAFAPAEKIRLLNNAINLPDTSYLDSKAICAKYNIPPNSKVILSFGRFTQQKGYDILIDAFSKLIREEPESFLIIGGDGPDRPILERLVEKANLTDRILLPGIIHNTCEFYLISDVYVNSSRYEGLPITLLEAMAYKKPIVATSVGGNCEVIRNENTGLIVEKERPDLLAEAILRMLKDTCFASAMAENAYAFLRHNYTIEKHCEALTHAYL